MEPQTIQRNAFNGLVYLPKVLPAALYECNDNESFSFIFYNTKKQSSSTINIELGTNRLRALYILHINHRMDFHFVSVSK